MADLPELLDIADEVGGAASASAAHDDEKGDHESGSDVDDALETASDAAAEAEDSDDELAEDECKCLLCAQQLPSARIVFQHCASDHQFDFYALRRKHGARLVSLSLSALRYS